MFAKLRTLVIILFCPIFTFGQLQSGPMVGYSDYLETLVWVQTQKPAKAKIVYWETGNSSKKWTSDEVSTEKRTGFVAKLIADQVKPGKKYDYEIWLDNRNVPRPYPLQFQTQTLWQYRTDPPPMKFAVGSCTFIPEVEYDRPGRPYGADLGIFTKIDSLHPDFMIWGGDNVYYREVDYTRTGLIHRNTDARSIPEMQALLGRTHHYATWDDHDFGPNNSDRSFWLKNDTREMFQNFWGQTNYVFPDEAITNTFTWGDCQFFMLDDNWWKAPNELEGTNKAYFGKKQMDWLIDALKFSNATFKFVVSGGQMINPAPIFENYATFPEEREELLKRISEQRIPGLIFLSGDRHHTVLHKLDRFKSYPLYEFTVSPLTSGPSKPLKEEAALATFQAETLVTERNFGMFEVTGPIKERQLKVSILNSKGEFKWEKIIKANDLKDGK